MRTRLFAAALVACIPAVISAQRTRGGGASTDPSPSPAASAPSPSVRTPTSHDLTDLNPASVLIGKRKKASLADSTVAQLKGIEKKINERNAPFFATYDSVRKWTIPIAGENSRAQGIGLSGGVGDSKIAAGGTSSAEQAKMQSSLRDLRGLMGEFRERRKTDAAEALAVVPEAQKKAATDLVTQQDGDLDKLIGGGRP